MIKKRFHNLTSIRKNSASGILEESDWQRDCSTSIATRNYLSDDRSSLSLSPSERSKEEENSGNLAAGTRLFDETLPVITLRGTL